MQVRGTQLTVLSVRPNIRCKWFTNSFYRGAHRAKATSEKEAERAIASWAKRQLAICDKKIVNFVLQSTNLQVFRLFAPL